MWKNTNTNLHKDKQQYYFEMDNHFMSVKKNISLHTLLMSSLIVSLLLAQTIVATTTNTGNNNQNHNNTKNNPTIHDTQSTRIDLPNATIEPTPHYSSQEEKKTIFNAMPNWLMRTSLKNAPDLVKGILNYLKTYTKYTIVPSFHRMIFVGKPGTGKTTLAFALAKELKCEVTYIPAASMLGRYRNQTAVQMRTFFENIMNENPPKKIIIIDELHKLFEHHANDQTDDSQNAVTFWLMLDMLEKRCPNVIVIGTANSVDKLPPEIKSRFHGKIITIPLPHKNQKLQALKNILDNDITIRLDASIDERFMQTLSHKLHDCSLRDIQLLVDTAKMFKYSEGDTANGFPILLQRTHFEQAIKQLNSETEDGKKSLYDRALPTLKEIGFCLSLLLNMTHLKHLLATPAYTTTQAKG